jgi:hypothetical protein
MKFTIEHNRERIKRYSHIKPAPRWGSVRCSARCPGTVRTCTLKEGHTGLHVAHGTFKRVVAVWDEGIKPGKAKVKAKRHVGAIAPNSCRDGGLVAALRAFRSRVIRKPHSMEEVIFLILALSMAGFLIDIWLQVLGVR